MQHLLLKEDDLKLLLELQQKLSGGWLPYLALYQKLYYPFLFIFMGVMMDVNNGLNMEGVYTKNINVDILSYYLCRESHFDLGLYVVVLEVSYWVAPLIANWF